ncbi:hypothetical protein EDD15DRAFT_2357791 [Pisolithus albus]|nr:hypothetical protein EDD15DRAFT_2357791 [Pisolithus albus]
MLCPSWYAEDCQRLTMLQYLRPLNMFAARLDAYARRQASVSRATSWYQQTRTFYDPFEDMTRKAHKQIECPRCRTRIFVPFVNDNSTGYAESFSAICPVSRCRMKITNETLAVAKFVRDLNQHSSRHDCMAGSLITSSGRRDSRRASTIKDQLTRTLQYSAHMPLGLRGTSEIKEAIGYSLKRLRDIVVSALRNYPIVDVEASRILGAYQDGSPFSVDLLDAVLRQSLFTEKMTELGFLDLTASQPNSMIVPTLDIDLVWHTHQLLASRYTSDCQLYVGRYVDHELRVRESHLSAAFDQSCLAWQLRYKVPYMQCGCALPDETSWQKCRRLVSHHLRGRTHLQGSLHPDHIPATHPSIHNAILSSRRRVDNMPGWMVSHSDECRASSGYNRRPQPPPPPIKTSGVQRRPSRREGARYAR